MDKTKAKQLSDQIIGQECAGWMIEEYINCGKSAIVMKGKKDGSAAAIKIFDPDLIQQFGAEIQIKRIEREQMLVDANHPNLIKILDGGSWPGKDYYFIAMEYLPWKNLAEVLQELPRDLERLIISQVAAAAQYLAERGICHRDIKPENIAISDDFQNVKLLDLGVIKIQGGDAITDGVKGKAFIATLKYSPPELLLREENGTPAGWDAITFYQLGGVLHDLIMRRTLFSEFEEPYARLVNAVQNEKPGIDSSLVSNDLATLARHSLIKCPDTRLKLVQWRDFLNEPTETDLVSDFRSKILKEQSANQVDIVQGEKTISPQKVNQLLDQYSSSIESICRLECVENGEIFPPIEINKKSAKGRRNVMVGFDPTKTRGNKHFIKIFLSVEFVDHDNEVIEIKACATLSQVRSPVMTETEGQLVVYTGIYSADSVRSVIIPLLYQALHESLTSPSISEIKIKYTI